MQKLARDTRIAGMVARDRLWSLVALGLLWALYAFVFLRVVPQTTMSEVVWALAVGGGLVLLFNTAAIFAMVSHLSEDRDEIYGLDLHYLDASRKQSGE